MDDLISRQAAIDTIQKYKVEHGYAYFDCASEIENDIKNLPSAQPDVPDRNVGDISKKPEIICKDCKHSEKWYRDKSRCFLWDKDGIDVLDTGSCNYAERRTDEQSDRC